MWMCRINLKCNFIQASVIINLNVSNTCDGEKSNVNDFMYYICSGTIAFFLIFPLRYIFLDTHITRTKIKFLFKTQFLNSTKLNRFYLFSICIRQSESYKRSIMFYIFSHLTKMIYISIKEKSALNLFQNI